VDITIVGEGQKVPEGSLDMEDGDVNKSSLCITGLFLSVILLTGKRYMEELLHVCEAICLVVQWLPTKHDTVCCSTHHALLISCFKTRMEVGGDEELCCTNYDDFWEC
jgi:hypothetical protein